MLIELLPGHHILKRGLGRALLPQHLEELLDRLHRDPQSGDWVDDAVVAELGELIDVEVRGLAELSHVGQQVDLPPDFL